MFYIYTTVGGPGDMQLPIFSSMTISKRITATMMLPIVGMLGFAIFVVTQQSHIADKMQRLEKLATFAPALTNLVHELQKERGASAGFIGSGGKGAFINKLAAQRKNTDGKLEILRISIAAFNYGSYGTEFTEKMDAVRDNLDQLIHTRSGVDALQRSIPAMASYYTATIASMLDTVSYMAVLSENADITQRIAAYTSFLQAKERAGIERAMGSGGFSRGEFNQIIHQKYTSLIAQQQAFLSIFRLYATAEQLSLYDKLMQNSVVNEVDRMRKLALTSAYKAIDISGISGPYWFDTITRKINLLKDVENQISADLVEASVGITSVANSLLVSKAAIAAFILIAASVFIYILSRSIAKPLVQISTQMNKLSAGDMGAEIPALENRDEIGDMARAVQVFKESMLKSQELSEAEKQQSQARTERAENLTRLVEKFDKDINGVLGVLGEAMSQLDDGSNAMSQEAEQTASKAEIATASSTEASENVQSVTIAAEEFSSTVETIAAQVNSSAAVSKDVASKAEQTAAEVTTLQEAARGIGEVTQLITDIAEQTNLLALNATIEAARAGEAGKGFAVVASEVKGLASQTSKATEQISHQIDLMQNATSTAVNSIGSIRETIAGLSDNTGAIAGAIDELRTVLGEIVANVRNAAQKTEDVSNSISGFNSAAMSTEEISEKVKITASNLNEQSDTLRKTVDTFIQGVQAT
jgi:methyl-accepting chemotaxis protein